MPFEMSIIRNKWTTRKQGFTPPRRPFIPDNGHLVWHYPSHISMAQLTQGLIVSVSAVSCQWTLDTQNLLLGGYGNGADLDGQ